MGRNFRFHKGSVATEWEMRPAKTTEIFCRQQLIEVY